MKQVSSSCVNAETLDKKAGSGSNAVTRVYGRYQMRSGQLGMLSASSQNPEEQKSVEYRSSGRAGGGKLPLKHHQQLTPSHHFRYPWLRNFHLFRMHLDRTGGQQAVYFALTAFHANGKSCLDCDAGLAVR